MNIFKSFRRGMRRSVSNGFGNSWAIRSKFTDKALKQRANDYLEERQEGLLFIFGSGRSGTQLISDLLGASGGAAIFHEPNFREDVATMDSLRRDERLAVKYWREFRSVAIYKRWMARPDASIYGEINGTIRYQAPAIRKLYPGAKLFLLARDGRGVVRSVMGWPQFYGRGAKGAYALAPLVGDPYFSSWDNMPRFEKVCWSWRDTNEFLMKLVPASRWLQLERIATDLSYLEGSFSQVCNMEIPYEVWRDITSRRSRNSSFDYRFPSWENWDDKQKESFFRICGETMKKLGYEL